MRGGISHWRTIISMIIVTTIVSIGFWSTYHLAVTNQLNLDTRRDSTITYRTHNIAESRIYVSDYIGDQANTFALMRTLPLSDKIALLGIVDQGVTVSLHSVNLHDEAIQRDILYSAAVLTAVIKDAKYVAYQSGTLHIEVTRNDVVSFIPDGALTSFDQQTWDRVRRAVPEAVPSLIEVRNTTVKMREP